MYRSVQYRLVKGEYVLYDVSTEKALEPYKEKIEDYLVPSQYKKDCLKTHTQ